jgi:tetratricopeptide (TPR) repeat protein
VQNTGVTAGRFRHLICVAAITSVAIASPAAQDGHAARETYDRAVALEADGNYPAALSLLWAAAGAAPTDAEIQNRLGEALERIGALDAASDAYQRALISRPTFGRAMNNLVVALGKAGRGAEAVARAQAWTVTAPGDPDRLFTLALAQSEQDVEAAMRALREVIARRPDHALAHYNLALLLKRVDRIDDAIAAAERAAAIDRRSEAHLALGTLYFQRGDLERAATSLDAAIAANPRSATAWVQLGIVQKARRDLNRAAATLRRAIALDPEAWSAHAALATVLALAGDEAGARQASADAERRRSAERRQREAVTMTAVGVARLDAGDPATARERFAAAIAVDEHYAPAYYHLGRALQRLSRPDEARAAFEKARQLNPSLVAPAETK